MIGVVSLLTLQHSNVVALNLVPEYLLAHWTYCQLLGRNQVIQT